ncbi:hypothetical protein EVG20_g4302 [Dentipellis fragilis]|uniref:G-protein coupled receptors family 3 profile domain-containing protein n=1 Tax=Dentipellis fragilis TaxID=205917 RepID=A0A4Y9Z087_9AGAM|nr:hypothetical protein EVG20_g4302 [Dentipellis fragilis]
MSLSLDRAVLGSIFAECIMFGICLTVCLITAPMLIRARTEGGRVHKTLFLMLLLMLILATSHVALSFARVFIGFILMRDVPGGPLAYFAQLSSSVLVAKTALFAFQTLLGDTIYIWRCYVIWNKSKKIIVVPVITLLASLVCACVIQPDVAVGSLEKAFGAPNCNTACLTSDSVAIIWRIWRKDRSQQSHILIAVFEGGLMYTLSLVTYLALFAVGSNGQWVALDSITHFVPICFCLVILQIKYHNTDKVPAALVHLDASKRPWTGVSQTFRRPSRHPFHAHASMDFEAQAVDINISTRMENRHEDEAVDVQKNSFLGMYGSGDTASEV